MTRKIADSGYLLIVTILGLLLAAPAAATEEPPILIENVSLGFSGYYKVGHWTPVFVTLKAGEVAGLELDVIVPDGDGVPSRTTAKVGDGLIDETTVTVETYCKIGRIKGNLTVVVRYGDRTLAQAKYDLDELGPLPLPSDTPLLLAIGEVPNVIEALSKLNISKKTPITVAQLSDNDRLPSHWYGYDSANMVIVSGSRPETVSLIDDQVATALVEWVQVGGKLLLSLGQEAETLMKPGAPLAPLAPGKFVRVVSMRQVEPLEILVDSDDPLFTEDETGRPQDFLIPFFENPDGTILAKATVGSATIPLLVRYVVGFGQVTFLAMDVERPEFAVWNGTRRLVSEWLFPSTVQFSDSRSVPGELAHVGYDDLSGQLRAALDQFEQQGIQLVPFVAVLILGIFYMLLIAPGDYFLLSRFLRRMELTWVTFPVLVGITCIGIYFLARETKGDKQLLNQAELIDIDVKTGQVRADCWFSIFSPHSEDHDLSVQCQSLPTSEDQFLISWFGLPGSGLGGMRSLAATPQFDRAYSYGPSLQKLENVPIPIWSTKSFVARYQGQTTAPIQADLKVRDYGIDLQVGGTIRNLEKQDLRNCLLFHDRWVYPIGTIKSGETVEIQKDQSISIPTYFTQQLGAVADRNRCSAR